MIVVCVPLLGGCVQDPLPSASAHVTRPDPINLPPPPVRPLTVGIYNCIDTTGQRRPTGEPQELSTAVPMDCTPYLVEAILSLRPGYVYLVEREHLDEVLRERQLATLALNTPRQAAAQPPPAAAAQAPPAATTPSGATRPRANRRTGTPAEGVQVASKAPVATPAAVPPRLLSTLRVAEVLLVGQVVAYDRSTRQLTGGLALGGIGGDGEVVTDLITFSLRAIAVQTGEIIGETSATKSVTSLKIGGHIAQVFSTSVVEMELGGAGNEPVGLALSAAIHSALDRLVQNGIHAGWWA
ncbi:MAG TPA: CsgG/HfaB family protein [Acetobacteraceae bacterium]|nr:CsgG/HfaB family protein [Acetobacteraceae bacterium]